MPAQAGRWGRFSEHQARQLQRQVQAKEERIVELEMENAVLHLRLAQCRGMTGEAGSAAAGLCPRCLEQDPPRRSTPPAAPQLHRRVQKLKQDIKALRASSLAAFRACWEHLQDGLSAVEAAVQGAQLCHQALLAWQSKVGQLERSLQEADARYQLEKQKRRVLHNRLVELKGNIRVHCRIRPLLPFDKEFGDPASQDRFTWSSLIWNGWHPPQAASASAESRDSWSCPGSSGVKPRRDAPALPCASLIQAALSPGTDIRDGLHDLEQRTPHTELLVFPSDGLLFLSPRLCKW